MVRIIAGTLVDVGLGKIKPEKIPEIIKGGDRKNREKHYHQVVCFNESNVLIGRLWRFSFPQCEKSDILYIEILIKKTAGYMNSQLFSLLY